jgi:hypothetical protein
MEGFGIYTILKNVALQLNIYDSMSENLLKSPYCNEGLNGVSLNEIIKSKSTVSIGFPSYPVYIISFACTYIISAFMYLSDEIHTLGAPYPDRYKNSLIFLACLLVSICLFRITFSCDGIGIITFSVLLGIGAALLVIKQNELLFQKKGINILGIPLLNGKATNGQTLYICPTRNSN